MSEASVVRKLRLLISSLKYKGARAKARALLYLWYFLRMTRDEQWLLDEKYKGLRNPYFEADKKRLAEGEPLAYVIGWQPFLGLKIYLDSNPLIPRPETEWWTEQLLAHVGPPRSYMDTPVRFLDLCAGSGAIGCAALAKLPNAQVYFGEIDPALEATIRKNIRENNLDATRADVRIGDLFEPFGDMKFDVIAANPPYVPDDRTLPPSVADYEPALAFYAGKEGLDFIRHIALSARCHLAEGGRAWIECDRAHAAAACALFQEQGLTAEIRNDQYGKPRVVLVSFP
ncbi:MAG: HemK/PrmC family methyltransferase [Candidatus Paceibacterota bacterium]